jgi:hypothetical protein
LACKHSVAVEVCDGGVDAGSIWAGDIVRSWRFGLFGGGIHGTVGSKSCRMGMGATARTFRRKR